MFQRLEIDINRRFKRTSFKNTAKFPLLVRVIFLPCYSVENIEQQSTSQSHSVKYSAIDFFVLFFLLNKLILNSAQTKNI